MKNVTKKAVMSMFQHYIERMRYNQQHPSSSQDGLYSAGECREAEKWLKLYGVNVDYERIQDLVNGVRKPYSLEFDILKEDDMDFILLSADTYCINGMESYLAIYMVNMEDDSDITAYILAVPKRTLWCDAAKLDVLYAIGMEDEDVAISYSDAITCGPKAVIRMEVCDSIEGTWTDFAVFNQFMEEVDEIVKEVEETGEIKVDFQSEEAWNEILGW